MQTIINCTYFEVFMGIALFKLHSFIYVNCSPLIFFLHKYLSVLK